MKIIILTLGLFMFLTNSTLAKVPVGNLKINKPRLVITEENKLEEIQIFNASNSVQSIRVRLIDNQMDVNGKITSVDVSQTSAAKYLRVGPRIGRNMQPRSFQRFRIRARYNKMPDGEYRSNLFFEPLIYTSNDQPAGIYIQPVISYSIPVIVRKGETHVALDIKDTQAIRNKDDQIELSFTVTRDGNRSAFGNIEVYQIQEKPNNQSHETLLTKLHGLAIYVDINRRHFSMPLENVIEDNQALQFKIVYREDPTYGGTEIAEKILKIPLETSLTITSFNISHTAQLNSE